MKIKDLVEKLAADATVALPGYNVFMGTKQYFEQTRKELPERIIVIEPPEKFPLNYYGECQVKQEVVIYLGRKVAINQVSQSLESDSYVFDEMVADLDLYAQQVDDRDDYFIYADSECETFNPERGETVNNYAYLKTSLKLMVNG